MFYLVFSLMKKLSHAQIVWIIALLILIAMIVYPLLTQKKTLPITSFQECLDAGYPIMESYPRQCSADGNNFVEDIDENNAEWWIINNEWEDESVVFCTMDAKICPDGSAVGRQWPDCEFAPCPGE